MATVTAIRSGPWSVSSTWDTGKVPNEGDTVVIPDGITVTFDADASHSAFASPLEGVEISGELTFPDYGKNTLVVFWTKTFTGTGQITGTTRNLAIKMSPPNGASNIIEPDFNLSGIAAASDLGEVLVPWAEIETNIKAGDTSVALPGSIGSTYIQWFLDNVRSDNLTFGVVACDQYQVREYVEGYISGKNLEVPGGFSNNYNANLAYLLLLSRPVEIQVLSGDARYIFQAIAGKKLTGLFVHFGIAGGGSYSGSSPHITNSGDVTFWESTIATFRWSEGTTGNYKLYIGSILAQPYSSGVIFQSQALLYRSAIIGPGSITNNYSQLRIADSFLGGLLGSAGSANIAMSGCTICGVPSSNGFFYLDAYLRAKDLTVITDPSVPFAIGRYGTMFFNRLSSNSGFSFLNISTSTGKTTWAPKVVARNINGDDTCHIYTFGAYGVVLPAVGPYQEVADLTLISTDRGYSAISYDLEISDIPVREVRIPVRVKQSSGPITFKAYIVEDPATPDMAPPGYLKAEVSETVSVGEWREIRLVSTEPLGSGLYTIGVEIHGSPDDQVQIGTPIAS